MTITEQVTYTYTDIHSEGITVFIALYENHLSRFFWSLGCSFASNTADFEISKFNLTHKVPSPRIRHLK